MTVARRALRETGEDAVGRRRVVAAAETAGLCRTSDRLRQRRTGRMGKALFAVLCTCGHNIRKNRPGPCSPPSPSAPRAVAIILGPLAMNGLIVVCL